MAEQSAEHGKNSKKTNQRTVTAIWCIFADLNRPLCPNLPDKDAISICMNLTSTEVLNYVLACF